MSLLHRVWKYRLHYIIVLPAMFLLVIFKVVPFFNALLMAFKKLNIFHGLSESPWVGTKNFKELFADELFQHALTNTLVIKLEFTLVSGVVALIVALALSQIGSSRIRSALTTLFLIPYFIPSAILMYLALLLFFPGYSPLFAINHDVWSNQTFLRPLIILLEVIKTNGIPILIALAAIWAKRSEQTAFLKSHVIPAGRAIAAFMLLQLSTILSTDFELIQRLSNTRVIETVDFYEFRQGFMMFQTGLASAAWLVQFAVQLIFTIVAYLLVRGSFLRDLFNSFNGTGQNRNMQTGRKLCGYVLALFYAFIVLIPLYLLFVQPFLIEGGAIGSIPDADALSLNNFYAFLKLNCISVLGYMLIIIMLAYPLTVKALPGRGLYKAILLIILVMGTDTLQEYLLFHSAGMINTVFPQVISGFYSLIGVFVLKSIFNSRYGELKLKAEESGRGELYTFIHLFIPKVWRAWVALGVLQFVTLWNSYYSSLLYVTDPNLQSPIMKFYRTVAGSDVALNNPALLRMGAMISLPSILLLLIFRKWLTSEILLSQVRKL